MIIIAEIVGILVLSTIAYIGIMKVISTWNEFNKMKKEKEKINGS